MILRVSMKSVLSSASFHPIHLISKREAGESLKVAE